MDLNENDDDEILPDKFASNVKSHSSSKVSKSSSRFSHSRKRSRRLIKTGNTESSVWKIFNRNT